jgi:hypothetical protein
MSIPDDGAVNDEDADMEGVQRCLGDALDTLPSLTRAVYLLQGAGPIIQSKAHHRFHALWRRQVEETGLSRWRLTRR